jgi:hypothetical protein
VPFSRAPAKAALVIAALIAVGPAPAINDATERISTSIRSSSAAVFFRCA